MGTPTSIPDKQLVHEAQRGSETAFHLLFERYYDAIRGYAWKILGNESSADDVTQQTFIKVAGCLRTQKTEVVFKPWIYKIALNTARDHLRASGRYQKKLNSISDPEKSLGEHPHRFEHVAKILEKLPEEICQTVLLVFGQGLTQKESAVVLGCPEGTISWRISEARKVLRQQWEHNQP